MTKTEIAQLKVYVQRFGRARDAAHAWLEDHHRLEYTSFLDAEGSRTLALADLAGFFADEYDELLTEAKKLGAV